MMSLYQNYLEKNRHSFLTLGWDIVGSRGTSMFTGMQWPLTEPYYILPGRPALTSEASLLQNYPPA